MGLRGSLDALERRKITWLCWELKHLNCPTHSLVSNLTMLLWPITNPRS